MEINFRLTKGQFIALAAAVVCFFAVYHLLLNNSVEEGKEHFRKYLVTDCKSKLDLPEPGEVDEESGQKLVEDIQACDSIQIDDISANGGVLLSVSVRVELDDDGYIPNGEKVRYLAMSKSMVFPFTTFKIISGNWNEYLYRRTNAFFYYARL
ncbi:hypothetical protein EPN96_09535 [bacterium]|nr:MAG: hypothetical protein EPN96_09535 [bacterium]